MRKFNLEEVKAGKPICTQDGLPVRIICWNRRTDNNMPIIGLVKENDKEHAKYYTLNGECSNDAYDLYMTPIIREGYIGVYKRVPSENTYISPLKETKEELLAFLKDCKIYKIQKLEWEE